MGLNAPRNAAVSAVLRNAFENSGRTYEEIGKALGYTTHAAVWQYITGKSRIPIETAYDLALSIGLDQEEAEDFFLRNLRERSPKAGAVIDRMILRLSAQGGKSK